MKNLDSPFSDGMQRWLWWNGSACDVVTMMNWNRCRRYDIDIESLPLSGKQGGWGHLPHHHLARSLILLSNENNIA